MFPVRFYFSVVLIAIFFGIGNAAILNVPEDWESIQIAVNAAEEGDTVLVAPGQYVGGIDLNGPAITLASWILLDNNPAYIDSTIIEANMERSVLRIDGGEDQTSLIRGFTLRRGRLTYGGGVNCRPAVRPRLEDMVIRDCVATTQGGGIYLANSQFGTEAWLKRVKIINNEAEFGGAIGMLGASIYLDSCEITGNTATLNGGAIGTHRFAHIAISHTLISGNHVNSENNGATIDDDISENGSLIMDHVTMCENRTIGRYPPRDIDCDVNLFKLSNSVFWDSSSISVSPSSENSYVDYCCFWRGRNAIGVNEDFVGDNIIDQNPRFISPERGDYRLGFGSPCIDAGNPDSTRDGDGSPCDLGAFSFVNQFGWLEGRVSNRETNLPISGAEILIREGDNLKAQTTSDSAGYWQSRIHLPDGSVRLAMEARTPLYHPVYLENIDLNVDDTLWINTQLERVGLQISPPDTLVLALNPGDSLTARFFIANSDQDSIVWRGRVTSPDPIFKEPGAIEDTINAGLILEDDRLQGAVFANGSFYVAGSADNNDWNLIYRFNKWGDLDSLFHQPDISRYGMKDLAWDGELIWGTSSDSIYGFSPIDGYHTAFQPGQNPPECIVFDPTTNNLWISGITTDIVEYDREGNYSGRLVMARGIRKYGAAWFPDDPDGCFLHILQSLPVNDPVQYRILRFNPETGDTLPGMTLPTNTVFRSLEITNEFNPLGGWSYVTVVNRPWDFGSDQVVVFALEPFNSWLEISPLQGVLRPDDEIECLISLRAINALGAPFDSAQYHVDYVISIEGDAAGDMIIPIDLYIGVRPPDFAPTEDIIVPEALELKSIYPNPFNGQATIRFRTGGDAYPTRLKVYGLDGRLVENLSPAVSPPRLTTKRTADRGGSAKESAVVWNAEGLPGGVYFVRLESGGQTRTMKAVLLK